MYGIVLLVHIGIAILLIALVLIQHGKGAQAGAAFGSGASQTVFGSQGSGGFLAQSTWVLAALFFVTSITLAYLINRATYQAVTSIVPPSSINQSQDELRTSPAPGQKGSLPPDTGEGIPEVP